MRELLEKVGLEQEAESPIHNLSGGIKQKMALCTALATEAQMLILDEHPDLRLLRGFRRRGGGAPRQQHQGQDPGRAAPSHIHPSCSRMDT